MPTTIVDLSWQFLASMLVAAHHLARCCCTRRPALYLLIGLLVLLSFCAGRSARFQEGATSTGGGDKPPPNGANQTTELLKVAAAATAENSSLLYECEISYLQMDLSLIKFSINYLERLPSLATTTTSQSNGGTNQSSDHEVQRFRLPEISLAAQAGQLRALTRLNASAPFVFFINGFNTFGPSDDINATWMWDVARGFALRRGRRRRGAGAGELEVQEARNVIFLTWSIPNLFASNLLAMIPAYYKTVANYDLIVDCVARTLSKLVRFVDLTMHFADPAARLAHFGRWHFYGHSLGSHILSDAISRVAGVDVAAAAAAATVAGAEKNSATQTDNHLQPPLPPPPPPPPLKFGKLVGLDPATPCFVSRQYGISSDKVARAVHELLVVHSNAGFAGVPNERANLEIVLNGGTFQPGCPWYDFTCHHVRATDILSYSDDSCQMVAYKCSSYHHFKLGACETCHTSLSSTSPAAAVRNCVLVNLPEQHRDSRALLAYAERLDDDESRQLGEGAAATAAGAGAQSGPGATGGRVRPHPGNLSSAAAAAGTSDQNVQSVAGANLSTAEAKNRKAYYHFVSTSANFRFGPRKTHCLQHYQLRLLIYSNSGPEAEAAGAIPSQTTSLPSAGSLLGEKCKLSSFYVSSPDEIQLKLYYETEPYATRLKSRTKESITNGEQPRLGMGGDGGGGGGIKLTGIVRDLFHTSLVSFEGAPRLFTGAQLANVDWVGLRACLAREGATASANNGTKGLSGGPNFVLDVAFMSHTNHKIRHAFSSVLCGQLTSGSLALDVDQQQQQQGDDREQNNNTNNVKDGQGEEELTLRLCRRSELASVSGQIDRLLEHMRQHRLDGETWKVSLLNNLFSLFTEWEPF